ncbi:MAG: hypothetical protein PVSMB7_27220 [Chloroflexota bacterium]
MTRDWLLLIYAVPSQPSRKRAYVWRELKRLGAVYLRDGVALLPRRPDLEERLRAVAARIDEYEGTADLVLSPQFPSQREELLIQRFQEERLAEYRELHHACVRFLRDVLHDVDADDFSFPDVDNLDSELGRLNRWYEQIEVRNYFDAPGSDRVRDILAKCDEAFERFTATASSRSDVHARRHTGDDVFERLGSTARGNDPVPEDYPL